MMVIIVSGLPGSGKSYFAVRLAERMGGVYINSDTVRKEMLQHRTYSHREKLAVYEEMILRMKAALALEKNIVLDATFYKEALRDKIVRSLPSGVTIHIIEVVAAESLIRDRLQKPRPDSEANFPVYELIRNEWQPIMQEHLTLQSTDSNIGEMLQEALQYIQNHQQENNG